MTIYTANIIGAGKLGKTIAYLLARSKLITLLGIVNTSLESAKNAAAFIGAGIPFNNILELPTANITFITTPDSQIQTASLLLSQNKQLKPGNIVIHCSGALSSEILNDCKKKSQNIASIHPMFSFANPELSILMFKDIYCALEGDLAATSIISDIFNKIGAITYTILATNKSLYHIAGVIASNYLITLANEAQNCLKDAEIEENMCSNIVINILQNTLNQLKHSKSTSKALTGPIKRGDVNTIKSHIKALKNHHSLDVYKVLGLSTLSITDLSIKDKEDIQKILRAMEN